MEHRLNTIKTDLYNVFIAGNANNIQIGRVFILVAIPVITTFLAVLH